MDPISEYIEQQEPAAAAVMSRLRPLIDAGLPEAESKVWHRHPVWFLDGNPVVGIAPRKDGVHLLFWSGQSFEEPGLKASGSFQMAEATFVTPEGIDESNVNRWLAKSRDIQWDYKNIVKRKGKLERLK